MDLTVDILKGWDAEVRFLQERVLRKAWSAVFSTVFRLIGVRLRALGMERDMRSIARDLDSAGPTGITPERMAKMHLRLQEIIEDTDKLNQSLKTVLEALGVAWLASVISVEFAGDGFRRVDREVVSAWRALLQYDLLASGHPIATECAQLIPDASASHPISFWVRFLDIVCAPFSAI